MAFTNYDKCSLLLPMDGTNNGTTFTDWSPSPKTVTVAGNAKTVTAQSKYYGSSGYFANSASNYLSIPYTPDLNFGTGQFTIACWIYIISAPATNGELFQIIQVGRRDTNTGKGGYSLRLSSQTGIILESIRVGSVVNTSAVIPSVSFGEWVHVACTRDAIGVQFYINGVKYAGTPDFLSENVTNPSSLTTWIGTSGATPNWYSNGYIQDLIVIKGAALWTSDFEPPSRLIGQLTGNVKDHAGTNAQRTIVAMPRTTPSRAFTTTSDSGTGNYTLRAPSTESSAILLANEPTLYNDLVHRVTPE